MIVYSNLEGIYASPCDTDAFKPLGAVGELYPRYLKLRDGRVMLTFTVRCGRNADGKTLHQHCTNTTDGKNIGLRAVFSNDDGTTFDMTSDRLIIDAQPDTPAAGLPDPSGGGYGNTIQLEDGTLISPYSYRGVDPVHTHIEVARYRLV